MDFKPSSSQIIVAIGLCAFTALPAMADGPETTGSVTAQDNTSAPEQVQQNNAEAIAPPAVAVAETVANLTAQDNTSAPVQAQQQKVETTKSPEAVVENNPSASPVESDESSDAVEFSDQFLMPGSSSVDLKRFSKGNPTPPGTYKVMLYINDKQLATTNVDFIENGTEQASPCITTKLLNIMGVDYSEWYKPDENDDEETAAKRCIDIKKFIPDASLKYDNGDQRLDISIPQKYIKFQPQGYVDPSLWEDGVNAAMVSYDANYYRTDSNGTVSQSAFAGLKYGLNIGAWHFRSQGSVNWDEVSGAKYNSQNIYVQRDITALKAQMIAGNSYTSGDSFDSVSLNGVRLYSDDRMQPSSMNGYAPIIRGVAKTNAKVTVKQNGNTLSQTTVPPGPFEITDLAPGSSGTGLDVTIEEADGSKRYFTVPFTSVVQMQRPGTSRWEIAAGQFSQDNLFTKPYMVQGNYYHGINNTFTGYAGVQATNSGFYAGLLGLAMNTPIGAFALDITQSSAMVPNADNMKGQSLRVTYSKLIESTNTSFNVAAYRYSTSDYLTLSDAVQMIDDVKNGVLKDRDDYRGLRSQVQLSLSQPLGTPEDNYGSLFLSGSWQDYWGVDKLTTQFTGGYSGSMGSWGTYSINLQRSYDRDGNKDDSVYVNFSIPLQRLFGGNLGSPERPLFDTLNASVSSDMKGGAQTNLSTNGLSNDGRVSYGINTAYNVVKDDKNLGQIGGFGTYNSQYGPLSASVSADNNHGRQFSLSNSGGVVLHSGGVTWSSESISDTDSIVILNAPGARGAKASSGFGRIDSRGYAVSTGLSPYRENDVGIDISDMDADVEVENTSSKVVPRAGSVVRVKFDTVEGQSVLMNLHRIDKGFIPLGATVTTLDGREVGSVGQAGQAFVRGIDASGKIKVVWGATADQSCIATYDLQTSTSAMRATIILDDVKCIPLAEVK